MRPILSFRSGPDPRRPCHQTDRGRATTVKSCRVALVVPGLVNAHYFNGEDRTRCQRITRKNRPNLGRGPLVDVAQALSDVARSLEAEPDLQHVVEGIVAAVTETVPGAEAAGVSLREGRVLRTVAATRDLVERLNNIEHELDESPLRAGGTRASQLPHRRYVNRHSVAPLRRRRASSRYPVDARLSALYQWSNSGRLGSVFLETERVRRRG